MQGLIDEELHRSIIPWGNFPSFMVVGQFESKLALSVPKNAGRRALYKTTSPLYGLPL